MTERVTNVEETIASVLVGFSIYESVYTESKLAALNAVAGDITSSRAQLVTGLVVLSIACIRFTQKDRWANATGDRTLIWRLLSNVSMAGAIALCYFCLNMRVAFSLVIGLLLYQIAIIYHPAAPKRPNS